MIYCYYISRGLASLHKMYKSGNDVDEKPKRIGKFKTDTEAKDACLRHYNKSVKIAENTGRSKPEIIFM